MNSLLERARGIGPLLAQHRASGETNGFLAAASLSALHDAGLLKLWRPASLGGLEIDPVTYATVAEEIAVHDTAAAWLMMAANNASYDLRMANPRFVAAVYQEKPDALVCSSFNRPLGAEPSDGGFLVSGEVAFASGCRHADWLAHLALVAASSGEPTETARLIMVYHPRAKLEIMDDWDALGLRGTSSNTIRADRVFVPRERVIEFNDTALGPFHQGPLYHCPIGLLTSTLPPVGLGALRVSLDALKDLARHKTPFASAVPLGQRPIAQLHYGRALGAYRAVRAFLHAQLAQTWAHAVAGTAFTLEHKADLFLACSYALETCANALRDVATAAGTSGIYKVSPIERALRDVETLRHHAFGAENRYASVAQVYWETALDFPFLAMD